MLKRLAGATVEPFSRSAKDLQCQLALNAHIDPKGPFGELPTYLTQRRGTNCGSAIT